MRRERERDGVVYRSPVINAARVARLSCVERMIDLWPEQQNMSAAVEAAGFRQDTFPAGTVRYCNGIPVRSSAEQTNRYDARETERSLPGAVKRETEMCSHAGRESDSSGRGDDGETIARNSFSHRYTEI